MRRLFLPLLLGITLTACVGQPVRKIPLALYDFGAPAAASTPPADGVRGEMQAEIQALEIKARSWLDSPLMHYRLMYADPLRRHSFADNRWAAKPAELIQRHFQQIFLQSAQPVLPSANANSNANSHAVTNAATNIATGCRLDVMLDELEQQFDHPGQSRMILALQVALLPRHGETVLAQRRFYIDQATPSADARGGAAAMGAVLQAMHHELKQWLATPVATRCTTR